MTLEEAHVFLGVHTDSNPEEAYQQQLFEAKQYFTSRPVIRSTFESKLKKLEKIQLAAEIVGIFKKNDTAVSITVFVASASILGTFNEYQKVKNNLLLLIHQSRSFQELIALVKTLLNVHTVYSGCWKDALENKETVILSKEPDPVDFFNALNELKSNGIETFENLASNLTTINDLIRKESTRLFLLNQREKNG
jgi:hypothetical protein